MIAVGRTDDGSNESIVSSKFSERDVLNDIGKMTKMDKVALHMAWKDADPAQSFMFSRT